MTVLDLRLFGEFEARDGAGRAIAIKARKNRGLLAAVALSPSGSVTRERLSQLLWSDRGDEQARSSLRQALVVLRKDLAAAGASALSVGDDCIRLDPRSARTDAVDFQRLAASTQVEDLRAAMALYSGEFLAFVGIRDAAFEDWLRSERRRLSDLAIAMLERLWMREAGAARIDVAKRLVELDPLRESAHRRLIQAYAETGEKALALRQYETCRDMLRAEFHMSPENETDALWRSVHTASSKRGPPLHRHEGAVRIAGFDPDCRPSVAVLPLQVPSGEAELEVFSNGLTEDIISGLSRVRSLRVVSRSMANKGVMIDARRPGGDYGTDYILEGSVRRSGTRLRVTAQLIEAARGHHVWAGRIDRTLTDLFQLQDDISSTVVASVQTQLILSEGRSASSEHEAADAVPNLLARSWQQFLGLNRPSLANCELLARRALSLDQSSGMAHRMMAVALYHQVYMGFTPWTRAAIDDIYSHAKFSIEADDVDEYCHWAMECAYLLQMEHARALASLRRALDINPNCSLAHGSIGTVLAWSGEPEAAIESNELALRMNPDDPCNFFRHLGLALAHYLARRYDQALHYAIAVLHIRPDWWLGLIIGVASASQFGRSGDARRMLGELERVRPGVTCQSLSVLPFANAWDRQHLLDGLGKAGMSEGPAKGQARLTLHGS